MIANEGRGRAERKALLSLKLSGDFDRRLASAVENSKVSHFRKGSESVETIVSATGVHVRDDQLEDHLSLRSGTRLKILASAGLKVEVASETLCPQVLSTV